MRQTSQPPQKVLPGRRFLPGKKYRPPAAESPQNGPSIGPDISLPLLCRWVGHFRKGASAQLKRSSPKPTKMPKRFWLCRSELPIEDSPGRWPAYADVPISSCRSAPDAVLRPTPFPRSSRQSARTRPRLPSPETPHRSSFPPGPRRQRFAQSARSHKTRLRAHAQHLLDGIQRAIVDRLAEGHQQRSRELRQFHGNHLKGFEQGQRNRRGALGRGILEAHAQYRTGPLPRQRRGDLCLGGKTQALEPFANAPAAGMALRLEAGAQLLRRELLAREQKQSQRNPVRQRRLAPPPGLLPLQNLRDRHL